MNTGLPKGGGALPANKGPLATPKHTHSQLHSHQKYLFIQAQMCSSSVPTTAGSSFPPAPVSPCTIHVLPNNPPQTGHSPSRGTAWLRDLGPAKAGFSF